jgi:uncharacterized protein (TIGR00369 family)
MPSSSRLGVAPLDDLAAMSGKEIMQAMIEGKLPPPTISQTLSFRLVEVGDGFAAFEGETGPHLLNPLGFVHGGWILALVDSATGCAAHTLLPAGSAITTIETKANFTRPITKDTGRVRVDAHVVNRGRQIISAEARAVDANNRLLAHGTSTVMVVSTKPER